MNTPALSQLITAETFASERRRLIEAGIPNEAREFQELNAQVRQRDDYLYETYGKRYLESDAGRWIAISLNGEVIMRDTASDCSWAATDAFGDGEFAMRKLAEFPGHWILY